MPEAAPNSDLMTASSQAQDSQHLIKQINAQSISIPFHSILLPIATYQFQTTNVETILDAKSSLFRTDVQLMTAAS